MVFENTHKFWTPFWGSYNNFQALKAIFLKSLGLIYAYSNMNIPIDIKIKKRVASPSSGRILQLRKNHCAIVVDTFWKRSFWALKAKILKNFTKEIIKFKYLLEENGPSGTTMLNPLWNCPWMSGAVLQYLTFFAFFRASAANSSILSNNTNS